MNTEELICKFHLEPHPEGGYYREIYRSPLMVQVNGEERCASTSIYFLLIESAFSAFHRLRWDEIWHFYEGSGLRLYCLSSGGELCIQDMGRSGAEGESIQCMIPAGAWFAAEVIRGEFALVGCTVAPGFEFVDFELALRQDLIREFPEHQSLIERLTR